MSVILKCLAFLSLTCSVFGDLSNLIDEDAVDIASFAVWENGTVPFYIDTQHFDHEQSVSIMTTLSIFAFKTCLKFAPVLVKPQGNQHVMYFENPNGIRKCVINNQAHTVDEPHKVVLGYECLHSPQIDMMVMRALGFPMEHNRAVRDLYIDVQYENIEPNSIELYTKDAVKLPQQLRDLPYDVNSVLHFGDRDFTKNGHRTIIFKDYNTKQKREGLSPVDLRKIELVYGPECRKRDRQEKIELCQNYPGVARKKREAHQAEKEQSLRVNREITVPPTSGNVSDQVTHVLKDLGIGNEVQKVIDEVYKMTSVALTHAREKYCNMKADQASANSSTAIKVKNSHDILGLVEIVAAYSQSIVKSALSNLTLFCKNASDNESYQRSIYDGVTSCYGIDPRCEPRYNPTQFGVPHLPTQHRPSNIKQSTRHNAGPPKRATLFIGFLRSNGSTVEASASNRSTVEAPASNRSTVEAPASKGLTVEAPVSKGSTAEAPASRLSTAEAPASTAKNKSSEKNEDNKSGVTTKPHHPTQLKPFIRPYTKHHGRRRKRVTVGLLRSNGSAVESPAANESAAKALASNKSTVEAPASKNTTVETPASKKTTVELPVPKRTTVEVPVTNVSTEKVPVPKRTTVEVPVTKVSGFLRSNVSTVEASASNRSTVEVPVTKVSTVEAPTSKGSTVKAPASTPENNDSKKNENKKITQSLTKTPTRHDGGPPKSATVSSKEDEKNKNAVTKVNKTKKFRGKRELAYTTDTEIAQRSFESQSKTESLQGSKESARSRRYHVRIDEKTRSDEKYYEPVFENYNEAQYKHKTQFQHGSMYKSRKPNYQKQYTYGHVDIIDQIKDSFAKHTKNQQEHENIETDAGYQSEVIEKRHKISNNVAQSKNYGYKQEEAKRSRKKENKKKNPFDDKDNSPNTKKHRPKDVTSGEDNDSYGGFLSRTVQLSKANADFYNERKWPDGVIKYIIKDDPKYDIADMRERLEEVNRILKKKTCTSLVEISQEETERTMDYLVLDDSFDFVTGRVGGEQNFGVLELFEGGQHRQHAAMMVMAMLGFYFEVARHDRDEHIKVHIKHIRPDKLHHFEKIREDATFNLPYDYKSAMHPAWQFWRIIGSKGISSIATFKEKDPDASIMKSMGQNEELLSEMDIIKINSVYGTDCFKNQNKNRDK